MPVAFESVYAGFYLHFATHCLSLVPEHNRNRVMFVFAKLISKLIEAANGSQNHLIFRDHASEILRWIVHLNFLKKDTIVLRYTSERFEAVPTLRQVLSKIQILTELTTGYQPNHDPLCELDHTCSRELDAFLVQELRWFLSWIRTVSETSFRNLAIYQQRQSDPRGYERDLQEQRGLHFLPIEFLPRAQEQRPRERQLHI